MDTTDFIECDICNKTATHKMSNDEYFYCEDHYAVVGTCKDCGIEIHPSWDYTHIAQCGDINLYCRRCAKDQDPCDDKMQCDDCHEKEEAGIDGKWVKTGNVWDFVESEDLNDDGWARCTDCHDFHRPGDCVNDKDE